MISRILAFSVIFILVGTGWAAAQILDDSTKVIYGPTTTRYTLESDIFNNRETSYTLDTLLEGFHNYSFLQQNNNMYQDLGNLGTAMRPLFYQAPEKIGAMLGFNVYTPYAFDPDNFKYYNTKSPYSHLYYVQAGNGIQYLDVEHSQNINPRWNAGFRYRRPTAMRQFAGLGNINDRQTDSHAFALFSHYRSKDSTYQILGNFTVLNHKVVEQGGLDTTYNQQGPVNIDELLTNILQQRAILTGNNQTSAPTPNTHEIRNHIHIYQQYAPVQAFQLYHVYDQHLQINRFTDESIANGINYGFYPDTTYFNPVRTEQETKYLLFENKVGIKGKFRVISRTGKESSFNYRLHVRRRDYTLTSLYSTYRIKRNENFLGGWLNYYFADSSRFYVDAEYLIGGDYRARAEYQSRWLTAGYYRVNNSPTLVQQEFISNNFIWNNNFRNVSSDNAYANINVRVGKFNFQPSANLTNLTNYIYYNSDAAPTQVGQSIQIARLGMGFQFRTRGFHTSNQVYYTRTTGPNVIRMPEFFANSRVAFEVLFRKFLDIQLGLEVNYKSSYYGDAYMPVSQQYFLQNYFKIPGYAIADLFADFRIKRVRLFFKFSHVNQGFMAQPTYFAAPIYPGLPRAFGFGVSWLLFD